MLITVALSLTVGVVVQGWCFVLQRRIWNGTCLLPQR